MAIEKNIYFRHVNIYDNDIEVSHALSGQNGCFISRDSYENILHYNEIPDDTRHPDYPHIHSNLNITNFFVAGTIAVEWEWTEAEGYSEEQVDQYINLVSNEHTVFVKDTENNRLRAEVTVDNIQYADWEFKLIPWNLAAPKFKLIMASDDAEYVCITPITDPFAYTYQQRTVESGETATIEKLGDNVCYVLFNHDVMKGETQLNPVQLYKLTSGDITITNNSDSRTRIIRLYR